jgi:hypothetical protein
VFPNQLKELDTAVADVADAVKVDTDLYDGHRQLTLLYATRMAMQRLVWHGDRALTTATGR